MRAQAASVNATQRLTEDGEPEHLNSGVHSRLPLRSRRRCRFRGRKDKPPPAELAGVCGIKTLAMTYSRMGKATLPSARVRFTSEFGMGSGGSTPLWSPGRGWRVAG